MSKRLSWIYVGALLVFSGCASLRHAIPPDLLSSARVSGMQDIRAFTGLPSNSFKNDFIKLLEQEQQHSPDFNGNQTYCILALSGGAANGAYGAGLLNGWTRSGMRPVFKVVTGISTGAIIAPFAFLGSQYDDRLKEFYTQYSTKDIVRIRMPSSNSFVNTRPLEHLIERYFDTALLKEIAVEYNKGRRLYVGTTNLDAQQLVIWDMGRIAFVGDDRALRLFRKIILASASMPAVFPPVFLNVEAKDKIYDEMHVDGGVIREIFFPYEVLQGFKRALKEKRIDVSRIKCSIYIIKNGYVDPIYQEVPDKFLAIAARTVDAVMNAQSIGDIYRLYVFAKNYNGDFNLAYIPASHVPINKEFFDLKETRSLFELGFKEAVKGYQWRKTPPGLDE